MKRKLLALILAGSMMAGSFSFAVAAEGVDNPVTNFPIAETQVSEEKINNRESG